MRLAAATLAGAWLGAAALPAQVESQVGRTVSPSFGPSELGAFDPPELGAFRSLELGAFQPSEFDEFRPSEFGEGEAFLSSLALPGLAQQRMGQRRWIAYAGIEVLSAFLYVRSRRDAGRARTAYRDFAWEEARAGLSVGPRRDGDFDYYETLSRWPVSGAWDANAELPGVQPETDPSTYNGSVWALATAIFGVDPEAPERSSGYARALEYYRKRSYGSHFLWAWSGGAGDRERFGRLIRRSDDRFRDARRALWIVAVNHLLSAVDGLVAVRMRSRPGTDRLEVAVRAWTP